MARFRHKARLAAFPKGLLDDVVQKVLDAAEGMPIGHDGLRIGDDVHAAARLVEGRHLAAGARYRVETSGGTVEVTVASWHRAGRIRLDGAGEVSGHAATFSLELDMAGRELRAVRVEGEYRGPKGRLRSLRRATWQGAARFDDGRGPAVSLRFGHRFGRASVRLDCGAGWSRTSVTVDGRGRGVARPFVSPALLVARWRFRRELAEAVARFAAGWNATVPEIAGRDLRERPSLRHEVTVRSVSREWADGYVAGVREAVEGLRFKRGRLVLDGGTTADVRLVEGRHLEAGARYRLPDADVTVAAWGDEIRVGFRTDDGTHSGRFELRDAFVRWERAEAGGVTWEGHVDLAGWWAAETPLTCVVRHALGGMDVSVVRAPGTDEWALSVAATVEALDWVRPLVAVAGLLPLQDMFRETVDDLAARWDEAVASAPGDPRTAGAATVEALLSSYGRGQGRPERRSMSVLNRRR